ncbi:chorismate mutase [Thermodesulfobium acidiphilum]|uniref:chorismate mutase n=1 Tax=Thermodesulfobium acidiphilum TaxID=1794699 RepID=A0A2R4VZH9_THEAF|nr:chorismate mutase [Thermodesulfobium acidiphilum]AWB09955.1 chorismate mutase [Thermodesulfobium acidiphilum]PMP86968.1 MAG: chorismate mutase [Thermodesulfobium narugense]
MEEYKENSRLLAIRGATTLLKDDPNEIKEKVIELVTKMVNENDIKEEDMVNFFISVTNDIHSEFAGKFVRETFPSTPVFGTLEAKVVNAPKMCIRILLQCYSKKAKNQIKHIFLNEASKLRPDLIRD